MKANRSNIQNLCSRLYFGGRDAKGPVERNQSSLGISILAIKINSEIPEFEAVELSLMTAVIFPEMAPLFVVKIKTTSYLHETCIQLATN